MAKVVAAEGMWDGRRGSDGLWVAKGNLRVSGAAARHGQQRLRKDDPA